MAFLNRSEYDRGVNTFNPEGRIFQVEYAREAIKLGSTAIGVVSNEGVVLVVEKRIVSPLIESWSVEKIVEVDEHIGVSLSGLVADGRTLIDKARVEAASYSFSYNGKIKVKSIAQTLCDVAMGFGKGEDMPSRPFGVALLIAGVDPGTKLPELFHVGPSGTYTQWQAKAIGSGEEGAQNALKEEFKPNLSLAEATTLALKVLKQVMEEKIDDQNVQVATVTIQDGFKVMDAPQVKVIVDNL